MGSDGPEPPHQEAEMLICDIRADRLRLGEPKQTIARDRDMPFVVDFCWADATPVVSEQPQLAVEDADAIADEDDITDVVWSVSDC